MLGLTLALAAAIESASHRTPRGVALPNAMAAVFNEYVACLDSNTDMSSATSPRSFRAAVEKGISNCSARRADLVRGADHALLQDPDYKNATKRTNAVANAFDTQDAIQHAMAEGRVLYEGE